MRAAKQLMLPWAPVGRTQIAAIREGSGHWVEARVFETDVGVELEVVTDCHGSSEPCGCLSRRFTVEIRVRDSSRCSVNGYEFSWDLCESRGRDSWPFAAFEDWAEPGGLACVHGIGDLRRKLMCVFEKASLIATRRAIELCDDEARLRALEFAPACRFPHYALLSRDRTGRMRQLAEACPGLPTLCVGLWRLQGPESIAPIIAGVQEGRKLSCVLDAALEVWQRPLRNRRDPASHPLSVMRVMWRSAPAAVEPTVLVSPGLACATLTDMPACPHERSIWYRVLAVFEEEPGTARLDAASRRRLAGFVSRSGVEIEANGCARGCQISDSVRELVDYVNRSGARVPSRRAPVDRVLTEVGVWHAGLGRTYQFAPGTCLPPAPTGSGAIGRLVVSPISTVGEFTQESERMRHCAASYADSAVAGSVVFYRARYKTERYTLAIMPHSRGWAVVEMSGFANRTPTPRAEMAVRAWVAGIGALVEFDGDALEARR